jgi:tRNA A-37 threonylcarbamoyl transferase component Bud32
VAIRSTDNMQANTTSLIQEIAWNNLKHANRATLEPFQLVLNDSKEVLYCNEIVRVIPGKRLVAFGTWNNKPIVAKLFYQPGQAARHAKREWEGIDALLISGVLTPELYFEGKSKDNRVQVLIFEKILGQNLDYVWQHKTDLESITPLMQALTIELATHHVLGILQHDLHFKNFITRGKKIYTIDGGDLELFQTPLSKKASLENLALYFSQMGIATENFQETLFQAYVKSRGWLVKKQDLVFLKASLQKATNKRLESYSKKIMRNCTAFARQDTIGRTTIYDRNYESAEFFAALKNLDVMMTLPATTLLKSGRSATVVKVNIDGRPLVIKRYNVKGTFHWLRRALRETRATKGWRLGQRLQLLGVPTAKPVAMVEKRFFGLRGKSYLIMEYIEGEHSGEYFAGSIRDTDAAAHSASKVVSLLESLAKLRITHGDLKMTNILFEKETPVLIDLDGMNEHRTAMRFKFLFHKEIKRFMKNWRDRPTIYALFEQRVSEMYKRLEMKW